MQQGLLKAPDQTLTLVLAWCPLMHGHTQYSCLQLIADLTILSLSWPCLGALVFGPALCVQIGNAAYVVPAL